METSKYEKLCEQIGKYIDSQMIKPIYDDNEGLLAYFSGGKFLYFPLDLPEETRSGFLCGFNSMSNIIERISEGMSVKESFYSYWESLYDHCEKNNIDMMNFVMTPVNNNFDYYNGFFEKFEQAFQNDPNFQQNSKIVDSIIEQVTSLPSLHDHIGRGLR